jgi:hypothetical protein
LQIRELLAESVAFGRNSANHAMGRSQLLHHHIQVAVQGAERGIVRRAF